MKLMTTWSVQRGSSNSEAEKYLMKYFINLEQIDEIFDAMFWVPKINLKWSLQIQKRRFWLFLRWWKKISKDGTLSKMYFSLADHETNCTNDVATSTDSYAHFMNGLTTKPMKRPNWCFLALVGKSLHSWALSAANCSFRPQQTVGCRSSSPSHLHGTWKLRLKVISQSPFECRFLQVLSDQGTSSWYEVCW